MADGQTLLKGPHQCSRGEGHETVVSGTPQLEWTNGQRKDGLICVQAIGRWLNRIRKMIAARIELRDLGSAAASANRTYPRHLKLAKSSLGFSIMKWVCRVK